MGRRALILVGAVALAGCGSRATPRIVAWLDQPLAPYRTPPAQLVHYPANAPPCEAAQLRVRNGRTGAGLGNYLQELVITNVGPHACVVRGYPAVTALDSSGTRVPLHAITGGTYFGQLLSAEIPPGKHVFLDLGTGNTGVPAQRYRDLDLVLPTGTVHAAGTSLVVEGSLSMSRVGLPERYAQPRPRAGSPGTLAARILLPHTARHGALLRYTVVLRNATSTPVSFNACPGYTQSLFAQQASVRSTYRLNCKQVTTLAPHARQRYAMQLHVPFRAFGVAKIGWSLDMASGPFSGGVVRVR